MHEMVHCWQWNALGTAPSGLIEGIADFVRLKAGLSPPHWKRECGGDWDAGYQHTGYFLEWMEEKCGEGTVRKINDGLRDKEYDEHDFWTGMFGSEVEEMWDEYSKGFGEEEYSKHFGEGVQEEKSKGDEAETRETKSEEATSSQTVTNDECGGEDEDEDDELVVVNPHNEKHLEKEEQEK